MKREDGSYVFSEQMWDNDSVATFELVSGRDEFAWLGVPGELYKAHAPLKGSWGEDYESCFGNWRLAIFAPEHLETSHKPVPIVFCFSGIGGDYNDSSIYMPHVVNQGCIFVALEPHMHGARGLGLEPGTPWGIGRLLRSLEYMEEKAARSDAPERYLLNNVTFKRMVEELAFNIQQVTSMICQRYEMPSLPPCIIMGFSLGAFYSYQIAQLTPHCCACIGGGGAPDISNYKGHIQLCRLLPAQLIRAALRTVAFVAGAMRKIPGVAPQLKDLNIAELLVLGPLASAVQRLKQTPFQTEPINPNTKFHFVVGGTDNLVNYQDVVNSCNLLPGQMAAYLIPGVGHTPGNSPENLNNLGLKMLEILRQYVG